MEMQLLLLSTTSYKIPCKKNPDTQNLTEKQPKHKELTSTENSNSFLFIILIKKHDKSNVFKSIIKIKNHCLNVPDTYLLKDSVICNLIYIIQQASQDNTPYSVVFIELNAIYTQLHTYTSHIYHHHRYYRYYRIIYINIYIITTPHSLTVHEFSGFVFHDRHNTHICICNLYTHCRLKTVDSGKT